MKTALVSLAVLGFLFIAPTPSEAAWNDEQENESRVLSDRWNLWVGGFWAEFKTDIAVGSDSTLGTLIRLEDTLGLDEDLSTFRVGGFYRFNNKRAILFDLSTLNRSAVTAIDIDVDFEELMFSAGAIVNSTFDNDIFTVTYRHSFMNNGKTESGFTAGVSAFAFDVRLDGIATVDDGSGPVTRQREEGGKQRRRNSLANEPDSRQAPVRNGPDPRLQQQSRGDAER